MCGITFFLNKFVNNHTNVLEHRGPDNSLIYKNDDVTMCFDRLMINDLTDTGNQPFEINNCVLICNGEIFNHESLQYKYGFKTSSQSDCEIIIHMYLYLKERNSNIYEIIHDLCNILDGEFAFCLYDKSQDFVIFARDPFGVRPLFFDTNTFGFASEMKAFIDHTKVQQFPPGSFALLSDYTNFSFIFPYISIGKTTYTYDDPETILLNINTLLTNSVKKRLISDRSICCLLSGGLDSSLVASLVSKYSTEQVKTFSIGLEGSPDLYYAQQVADYINSDHTCITLSKEQFLESIEHVIKTIESYDTTTVRASVGNYLVCKYISENSNSKVVFNGDYADEVCGGYKYFENCPNYDEFHNECCRLVKDICYFDSLRSDRTISSNGLEGRVPFADKYFVEYYLSIHPILRMTSNNDNIEKYLLRKSFEKDKLLPDSILWRKKEAFSDGVSKPENSWSDIISNFIEEQVSDEEFNNNKSNECIEFKLKETYFYYKIFKKYYSNDKVIPYLWMPKYCNQIDDPSARKI